MHPVSSPRDNIVSTLREVALLLGGVFHAFDADDDLVAAVTKCLSVTFKDALDRQSDDRKGLHPGITDLLDILDRKGW